MSKQRRRAVATHEAGHAVVALHLGREILDISVFPYGEDGWQGVNHIAHLEDPPCQRCAVEDALVVLYAGTTAAHNIQANRPGSSDRNSLPANRQEANHAGYFASATPSLTPDDRLMAEAKASAVTRSSDEREALLTLAAARAMRLVHQHRQEIEVVAEALLEAGELTGDDINDLLAAQRPLRVPKHAAQRPNEGEIHVPCA